MSSILLKNCFYIFLSADEESRRGDDILIRDNRITRIAANITDPADRIIDGSSCVVVPGLVNTHHHFYQTLTRNLPAVQNAELFDWLTYLYEIWKHLDEEAVYYSSLLAMAELLKTGCTTSTDHHYLYPQNVKGTWSEPSLRLPPTWACGSLLPGAPCPSAKKTADCHPTA